jgi:membrane fusion protein, multidrug efflux system
MEIVTHVPERIVRVEPRRAAGRAILEGMPDRPFPVTLKSFATEADPQTQTYEVVLGFTPPEGMRCCPACRRDVSGSGRRRAGRDLVPLAAVLGAADGAPTVWLFDPATSRVSRRPVAVGALRGSDIVILEGLAPGDRIVAPACTTCATACSSGPL